MKKLLALACACIAFNANAALIVGDTYQDQDNKNWTYIGDYDVAAGPVWSVQVQPVYSAIQAATIVFGQLTGGKVYAISTSDTTVDHLAWYDGYGTGVHLPTYNWSGEGVAVAEGFFADVGEPGYEQEGDFSAYIGGDRASSSGVYNHVFVSAAAADADVPEPASLALLGAGLLGASLARRQRKQ